MEQEKRIITPQMYMQAYAISPLDGRYQEQVQKELAPYYSEFALVKYRVKVETYWLGFLLEKLDGIEAFDSILNKCPNAPEMIKKIFDFFKEEDYFRVKEIENVTNHDVKAVELFVVEKLKQMGLGALSSYVHIGCTSEDITNPAYATMIASSLNDIWLPTAEELICAIGEYAIDYADTPMPAHTHGQFATPTTVGKEFLRFSDRLRKRKNELDNLAPLAKFNGATGNYSAISMAFPEYNWPVLSKEFIEESLELKFTAVSSQIEPHDYEIDVLNGIRTFNSVLRGFDWDLWDYISRNMLKQKVVDTEVGSSTMPQKVNPIQFENSAGNIVISNALCYGIADALASSRMQRDLSDSTIQRGIGSAIGHSLLALKSTAKGLKRIAVNELVLEKMLDSEWSVLGEAVQTVMRKYGISDAYDQLKAFTRGKHITKELMRGFIETIDIPSADKARLLELTPAKYTGLASKIIDDNI